MDFEQWKLNAKMTGMQAILKNYPKPLVISSQ